MINREVFKGVEIGTILQISLEDTKKIICKVKEVTFQEAKKFNIQISIVKRIAELFSITGRTKVKVRETKGEEDLIHNITIGIKEKFFSRRDMFLLTQFLQGKIVYKEKDIEFSELRAKVKRFSKSNNTDMLVGLVGPQTKFEFYSKSCKCFWIVKLFTLFIPIFLLDRSIQRVMEF